MPGIFVYCIYSSTTEKWVQVSAGKRFTALPAEEETD